MQDQTVIWVIADVVAEHYQVPVERIMGMTRHAKYARPRQIAYYLCVRIGYSLTTTGRLFRKNHATILYGIRNVQELCSDIVFNHLMESLEDQARRRLAAIREHQWG